MKWYCSISRHCPDYIFDLARVALYTARVYTDLSPHIIYDYEPDEKVNWFVKNGAKIISHRSSLFFDFLKFFNTKNMAHNSSAIYGRVDIPIIEEEDDFVLYTDCDVMFQKTPFPPLAAPAFFACAPEFYPNEWSYFNTGVMLMNVKALRAEYDKLIEFIKPNIKRFSEGSLDQVAYNEFYKGRFSKLPIELNWKLYWGKSEYANIIHFHGCKPPIIKKYIAGQLKKDDSDYIMNRLIKFNDESSRYYYNMYTDFLKKTYE